MFAVELGAFRNFNQILIVGGTMDFGLSRDQWIGNVMHLSFLR
jgi:hypothetical protein